MFTDAEKRVLLEECEIAIVEFLRQIKEIEKRQNVYVQLECEDIQATPFGSLFVQYLHNIRVRQILVQ